MKVLPNRDDVVYVIEWLLWSDSSDKNDKNQSSHSNTDKTNSMSSSHNEWSDNSSDDGDDSSDSNDSNTSDFVSLDGCNGDGIGCEDDNETDDDDSDASMSVCWDQLNYDFASSDDASIDCNSKKVVFSFDYGSNAGSVMSKVDHQIPKKSPSGSILRPSSYSNVRTIITEVDEATASSRKVRVSFKGLSHFSFDDPNYGKKIILLDHNSSSRLSLDSNAAQDGCQIVFDDSSDEQSQTSLMSLEQDSVVEEVLEFLYSDKKDKEIDVKTVIDGKVLESYDYEGQSFQVYELYYPWEKERLHRARKNIQKSLRRNRRRCKRRYLLCRTKGAIVMWQCRVWYLRQIEKHRMRRERRRKRKERQRSLRKLLKKCTNKTKNRWGFVPPPPNCSSFTSKMCFQLDQLLLRHVL
jgi:hypothetical protein